MQNIAEKVIEVVSEALEIFEPEQLRANSNLYEFGLDSLNAIILVSNLEKAFNIEIEDEELLFENFDSVPKIIELVSKKLDKGFDPS